MTKGELRNDCFNEGWEEQRLGGGITANPHQAGSDRWVWWRQGFSRAEQTTNAPRGQMPSWRPGL